MVKHFFLLLLSGLCSMPLMGQSLSDSLLLKEVVVYGIPEQKFAVGSKIIHYDSLDLSKAQSRSLAEALMRKSPVYFKEYGPGMLSTISFRGTSANHTAVLWNGLNLNQPNLGQTDFSLITLFAIEDISLQYGGSSALYGSDAIGGTIYLKSSPRWDEQLNITLQQEVGSFGHKFSGLALQGGYRNWSVTSKAYHKQADNDFEYINPNKRTRPVERNRNAAFAQKGLVQDIAYRFSNSSKLSLKSWYQQTERQIQPTIGDQLSKDQQEDENLKVSLQYKHNGSLGFMSAQFGYLYNYLLYNRVNEYKTWQYIGSLRHEKAIGENFQLQLGGKINRIEAAIAQYPGGAAEETRSDLYASLRYSPAGRLKASVNLRQALVSGYSVPFTPSTGLEYSILSKPASSLKWLASAGRSYRVPTLNDRYWQYGGNPELRPEDSWNTESTLSYQYQQKKSGFEISATAFHMWIDNWILWLPGTIAGPEGRPVNVWTPRNIQQVNSKGIEVSANMKQATSIGHLSLGGNWSFTRSINKKAMHQYDRSVGRQLPFVPRVKTNAYLDYHSGSWSLSTNWSFVSTRYTTGEEQEEFSVPAFQLIDFSAGRAIQLQKHKAMIRFEIRNLLNEQYQNYDNRAMPGRNYLLSIRYHFNHPL